MAGAIVIVAILRVTGLMSYVSFASQWAIMQTGLRDADDSTDEAAVDFNYDFTIKDLQGNKTAFESYRGRVVFLNLWATWCGPCRAEMPGIEKLYQKLDKSKFAFVMLSLDKDEDLQKIKNYVSKNNYSFPVFQPSGFLPDQLQVPSIPTTFIISPNGKILKKHVGTQQYDTEKFRKFLEQQAAN